MVVSRLWRCEVLAIKVAGEDDFVHKRQSCFTLFV